MLKKLLLGLVLSCLCVCSGFSATTVQPGLFAGYDDRDAAYSSVTLLLHLDGTNGSTTFTDQKGNVFTGSGGAALSTSQKQFGSASLLLATASSQYIGTPSTTAFDFGSGDFTVELWIRPVTLSATIQAGISNRHPTISGGGFNGLYDNTFWSIRFFDAAATSIVLQSPAMTVGVWNYVATCRQGNTWTSYTNGVAGTPITSSLVVGAAAANGAMTLYIGRDGVPSTPRYADAYFDDVRITKGAARCGTNIPGRAFPNQ